MSSKNIQISSENHEMRGELWRSGTRESASGSQSARPFEIFLKNPKGVQLRYGGVSRYVDEQFVICSRNLDVLADKQDIGSFICGEILNRL